MNLRMKNPVLVCIDLQLGFLDEDYWGGNRNNSEAEQICARLITKWRAIGQEIIHIRHSSTNPASKLHKDSDGFAFNPLCKPEEGETILTKSVNSGFIGTDLKSLLDQKHCQTLVIIGLTTDHCVSTTTRMAGNYGYETFVVSDATATFDKTGINGEVYASDLIHHTALASLQDEFATILSCEDLLAIL